MEKALLILTVFLSGTLCLIATNNTGNESQFLTTLYKEGDIKLVPDEEYAKNNDWSKIFYDSNESSQERNIGLLKDIVVAPDGSVFMSHRTRYSISKFDKNGNYIRDFGKKGGKSPSDFIYGPTVEGIIDGKYIYTSAVDGRMHFFNLDGQWVKTITLKYMPLGSTPLKGGKFAVLGYVPWKGGSKLIISILDLHTEAEKIIWSEIRPTGPKNITVEKTTSYTHSIGRFTFKDTEGKIHQNPMISCSLPFSNPSLKRIRLATSKEGNLIVANPMDGILTIYDTNGKDIKKFKPAITPDVITSEDREKYYQKANEVMDKFWNEVKMGNVEDSEFWVKYLENYKKTHIEKFRDPASYPEYLPYFSEIAIDSENNILLFRFAREKGINQFDVFTFNSKGEKIATSRFTTDNYDLKINPSVFKFNNQNIYCILKPKNKTGDPLCLVKFKLQKY